VKAARSFSIHGDMYYEIQCVRTNDPGGTLISLRLPQHTTAGEPQPGQTLLVKFLMGQVTEARLAGTASKA
jgi:hypothetical protein